MHQDNASTKVAGSVVLLGQPEKNAESLQMQAFY